MAQRRIRSVLFGPFGLVWARFGWLELGTGMELWRQIDDLLAEPIDRDGYPDFDLHKDMSDTKLMNLVIRAQEMIQDLMNGLLEMNRARETIRRAAWVDSNPSIIVLDGCGGSSWKSVVSNEAPDVIFVVYPGKHWREWIVERVPDPRGLRSPATLPEVWRGKTHGAFVAITGVVGALETSGDLLSCKACSKEGAVALAKLALEA